MRIVTISILVLLLAVGGYVYWYYYNPYSNDGLREGVLQKFSRKGNVFKTHEGEMLQLGFGQRTSGFQAQYFYFSVVDQQIADSLKHCLGKVVLLHYIQYRRSIPWRGEDYGARNTEKGQYIVDRIDAVKDPAY